MGSEKKDEKTNIVDLAEKRKHFLGLRKLKSNREKAKRDTNSSSNYRAKGPGNSKVGFWAYVNFFLFLAFVVVFMKFCTRS